MNKPVVLIAEELSPATVETLGPDVEIRRCNGADRVELLTALAEADALLIRSATQVDAEAIAAARRLKVVARAGVGLDNVDLPAATRAGVMVVNAPMSNIVTAAELACGLLLAIARHIPQANASLKAGEWKRSKYVGVELAGKTLGVVGLGRIGQLVAHRMKAFGMNVVAYDPHVPAAVAAQAGVRLLPFDALLESADFITVHLPKTPETMGLIGHEALSRVKPTVRIVNAARGGIVDEEALAAALREGRVAAAGLDVFASEPCTASPLFDCENVVVTPHIGAATGEAQEKAGVAVAHSVRQVLAGELVVDAVNVHGGPPAEQVRPAVPLAYKLGRVFAALAEGEEVARLDIEVHGELVRHDVKVLELSTLRGVFETSDAEAVTLVNAPLYAQVRGVSVHFTTSSENDRHRILIRVRGTFTDGRTTSISGTLAGIRQLPKIAGIGDYDIDLDITDHMLFLQYKDMPGMVGSIGRILGEAGINIANMQVARVTEGGEAAMALTVDDVVPSLFLSEITDAIGTSSARFVNLAV
ncbi:phosphoglycerate dehydrogenase [Streptomyces sp. NPDC051561]|uniref:phosphoglycerate dehydrogenase n=1 Tax=Streptomyces sp. NPDC051561 TaxID=3365658 RepID=UPI003796EA6C